MDDSFEQLDAVSVVVISRESNGPEGGGAKQVQTRHPNAKSSGGANSYQVDPWMTPREVCLEPDTQAI